jgi:hypothetical protein
MASDSRPSARVRERLAHGTEMPAAAAAASSVCSSSSHRSTTTRSTRGRRATASRKRRASSARDSSSSGPSAACSLRSDHAQAPLRTALTPETLADRVLECSGSAPGMARERRRTTGARRPSPSRPRRVRYANRDKPHCRTPSCIARRTQISAHVRKQAPRPRTWSYVRAASSNPSRPKPRRSSRVTRPHRRVRRCRYSARSSTQCSSR